MMWGFGTVYLQNQNADSVFIQQVNTRLYFTPIYTKLTTISGKRINTAAKYRVNIQLQIYPEYSQLDDLIVGLINNQNVDDGYPIRVYPNYNDNDFNNYNTFYDCRIVSQSITLQTIDDNPLSGQVIRLNFQSIELINELPTNIYGGNILTYLDGSGNTYLDGSGNTYTTQG